MRCFVVILLVVACAGFAAVAAAPAKSCASSKEFFARHNASADDSNGPGPICNGDCCGRGRESRLRASLKRLAVDRAIIETRPVAELLLSTRRTLLEHLLQLSHQSQNKTNGLLTQLYRSHAVRAHRPLANLYDDIRLSLRMNVERDSLGDDLGTQPPRDLAESARKFFEDVFPVAYQSVLKLEAKQFTVEYEACLKDAYNAVKPFGDVPQKMGASLSRSLKAARALLEVLAAGAGVLAASEHVLSAASEECSNHLLRAVGCSRCKGYSVKPCRAYCLNVARGCIGSLVAELDAPWAGYVEGLERLVRAEADVVLREIEGKVSEAIMYALENQVTLENKVRQECGPTSTMDGTFSAPSPTPPARRNSFSVPPPDALILEFTASLAERKKLFAGVADDVCEEPDFAEIGNDNCWDGKTIGEYTKPLVLSASLADQKYNPEVSTGVAQGDAKVAEVAALGDKLRQARQLLVTTSWGSDTPAAESFMQGDEANEEGSGSGRGYDDDSSYDQEGSGEEGSGIHIGTKHYSGEEKNVYTSTPKTAGTAISRPLTSVIFSVAIIAIFSRCTT